jgi:hypothetical protein
VLAVLDDGVLPDEIDARRELDGTLDAECESDSLMDKLNMMLSEIAAVSDGDALVDALVDSRALIFAETDIEGEAVGDREDVGEVDVIALDEIERESRGDDDDVPVIEAAADFLADDEAHAVAR